MKGRTHFLLGGLLIIILLRLLLFTVNHIKANTNLFDRPYRLTGQTETIDVDYINWACDCANFIDTRYYENTPNYEAKAEDCLFIEPASPDLKIPEQFYTEDHFKNTLRLTGQYYKAKGIPKTYEQKTPEKPERAKVFRYEKVEVVPK